MNTAAPATAADDGLTVLEVWRLLRRRRWLVVGLPVAVALLSLATAQPPPVQYQARLAFAVDVPPSAIVVGSDEGSAAKIGEALIDDISRIIPRNVFAAAVARRLPAGMQVAPGELASETSATDRHRVSDVTVTRTLPPGGDAAALQRELTAIAEAVVAELQENAGAWFARLGEDAVQLTIVDAPAVVALPPSLRQRLELPLRLLAALVIAVGLALLLHAVDPHLYDEADARRLAGAPILARVPRHKPRPSPLPLSRWRGRGGTR
jgi:capsular polysaccharide biosynthesis protein